MPLRWPRRSPIILVFLTLSTLMGCSTWTDLFGSKPTTAEAAAPRPAQTAQANTRPGFSAPRAAVTDVDPSPSNSIPNRVLTVEQKITALQQEIDRIGPAVERLANMENDLRTLVALVRRPPDGRTPAGSPLTLSPGPTLPSQPGSSTTVATRDQFSLHFASYKDQETARKGWKDLSTRYADLLGSLDYRISSVSLGADKGTMQRLKAGPFTDAASANEVCKVFKARKAYCVVTDFSGAK
jgi:hypothetical protein